MDEILSPTALAHTMMQNYGNACGGASGRSAGESLGGSLTPHQPHACVLTEAARCPQASLAGFLSARSLGLAGARGLLCRENGRICCLKIKLPRNRIKRGQFDQILPQKFG